MAATQELNFILRAKNETEKAFKDVQANVGGLESRMKSLQPAFKKMAVVGTAAFAAIGVGVYKMSQDAVSAQEIFNKFDVVFKDVSDEAEKVAQDLRNNFGLAESSAKDLLSATGDMLTGFGLSGEAALDLAGRTNRLAVDLASFTNIEGGAERASKALTKALLGQRESVKELGIAILEEDVVAKVAAMEAAGEFTDETDRQKRALATLEIAIGQSKNAVGDFARTQDSVANQQRVLKERTKELSETIGVAFLPILQQLIATIQPIIKRVADWTAQNPELTKNIALAALAITGLIAAIGTLGLVIPPIITGFTLLASPIGLVIAAVLALIVVGYLFVTRWEEFKETILWIWEEFTLVIQGYINRIKKAIQLWIDYVKEKITTSWTAIKEFFIEIWERIKDAFASATDWLKEKITTSWTALKEFFIEIWEGIKDVFARAIDWLMEKLQPLLNMIDRVKEGASFVGGKISSGFQSVLGGVKGALGIQDAIITPQGKVIQTDPADYILATKKPESLIGGGGALVININGGYFLSENVAQEIGDQIINKLKKVMRL